MIKYTTLDSPIGTLTISTDGNSITGLHIEGDRYFTSIPKDWQHDPKEPLLIQAKKELSEYFSGKRKRFDLPFITTGTEFQKQVWTALTKVPLGKTVTYGAIAKQIGRPQAVRAVGSAVGRNPVCLIVPCHRVIGSNGKLGNFGSGPERKQKLLAIEGVDLFT